MSAVSRLRSHAMHVGPRTRTALYVASILVVALALYSPALGIGLLSDDWHLVWIAERSTQPWFAYFWTNYAGTAVGYAYRPLQIIFFIVADAIGGIGAWPYHAIQISFHLANVALVFALARRLAGKGGAFLPAVAALLFAVFPNHVEAVVWPSAIGDPTATFFMLVALNLWIAGREGAKIKLLALSWIASALALASKDMAISVPFLILAWEAFRMRREGWPREALHTALRLAPFFAILAGYFALRLQATGYLLGYYGAPKVALDPMVMVRTYLAIPVSHFVSGGWRTGAMDWLYRVVDTRFEALAIAAAAVAALLLARASRNFWWLASAFAISIGPVAQLGLNHLPGRISDEGERYAYLPSVFMALMLAWAIDAARRRIKIAGNALATVAVVAIATAMSFQLSSKIGDWRHAGEIAGQALESWHEAYAPASAGETFVVGLPDNFRGVPLWRNGLVEAHELVYGMRPEFTVTALRTVVDSPHRFTVLNQGGGRYSYISSMTDTRQADIVGPLSVEEAGYSAALGERTFSIYALTYRDFSDSAEFSFGPWLAANPGRRARAMFWDGEGWSIETAGPVE